MLYTGGECCSQCWMPKFYLCTIDQETAGGSHDTSYCSPPECPPEADRNAWLLNTQHTLNEWHREIKPELIWKLTCSGYLKGIMQAVGMGKPSNAHIMYTLCATVMDWLRDIPTRAVAAWISQGELTTSWWMAIVSYIVQYLNTLGEGKNFYLRIFLPASMAFELWGTNYPHVFF